mmetsp:Transcript_14356/g.12177  ORF Transcript_14356/g.12177 Transcript_14356/m.12177 type:complete len:109 (-) Transcript_14356:236-562(-)
MIGFTVPLAPALATELTPVEYRGRGIVALNFFFSVGKFYAVLVAKLCLDNLTSGNWRLMLIGCTLPSLIVFIGVLIFMKESPRFLIATGNIKEGAEILNYISERNGLN